MLHVVVGRPGAGKSYYLVRELVWWLVHTNRQVVTNLPIVEDRLVEYISSNYGKFVVPCERVDRLTDDEVGYFWRFRGWGEDGKRIIWGAREVGAQTEGVTYLFQEMHLWFSVRDWQKISDECTWYLSQHRKLGDEIFIDTQHPDMLVKQLRLLVQDWTWLRNWGHESFGRLGIPIKLPKRVFWSRTSTSGENRESLCSGIFRIEDNPGGLAHCYRTSEGSGIVGSAADVGNPKRKGVHWLLAILGVVLVAVGIGFLIPKFFGKVARTVSDSYLSRTRVDFSVSNSPGSSLVGSFFRFPSSNSSAGLSVEQGTNDVRLTTFCCLPDGRGVVGFSDGRTFRLPDSRVFVDWSKRRILFEGRVWSF